MYNTPFELSGVRAMLLGAGFGQVRFLSQSDLATEVEDPEAESRVFVAAS